MFPPQDNGHWLLRDYYSVSLVFPNRLPRPDPHCELPILSSYLGGFLSAYALTEEETFKTKADDLGTLLLEVFQTKSGLPVPHIFTHARGTLREHQIGLAEMSTFQMVRVLFDAKRRKLTMMDLQEFKYLAHITGKKVYYETVS